MVVEKEIINENISVKQSIFIKKSDMIYNSNTDIQVKDVYINSGGVKIYYREARIILLIFGNCLRLYYKNGKFYTKNNNIITYYPVKDIYLTVENSLITYDTVDKKECLNKYGNNIYLKKNNGDTYDSLYDTVKKHNEVKIIKHNMRNYCLNNGKIKRHSVKYYLKMNKIRYCHMMKFFNGLMVIMRNNKKLRETN